MNKKYKTSSLIKSLISFFLVLLPSLIIWFFFSKDWTPNPIISYKYIWLIALGFVMLVLLISWIFVITHIAWYDLFNFTLPIAILMMLILITYPLTSWARALIIIGAIIVVTLPINMFVTRLTENASDKEKEMERQSDFN